MRECVTSCRTFFRIPSHAPDKRCCATRCSQLRYERRTNWVDTRLWASHRYTTVYITPTKLRRRIIRCAGYCEMRETHICSVAIDTRPCIGCDLSTLRAVRIWAQRATSSKFFSNNLEFFFYYAYVLHIRLYFAHFALSCIIPTCYITIDYWNIEIKNTNLKDIELSRNYRQFALASIDFSFLVEILNRIKLLRTNFGCASIRMAEEFFGGNSIQINNRILLLFLFHRTFRGRHVQIAHPERFFFLFDGRHAFSRYRLTLLPRGTGSHAIMRNNFWIVDRTAPQARTMQNCIGAVRRGERAGGRAVSAPEPISIMR